MRTISPTGGNGALHKVQCKTWTLAKQIRGQTNNVSRVNMSEPMPTDGLFRFRCIPAYRSPDALALRKQVADILRRERCG